MPVKVTLPVPGSNTASNDGLAPIRGFVFPQGGANVSFDDHVFKYSARLRGFFEVWVGH